MVRLNPITEFTTHSCEPFDSKINNWAEGTILTLDADNGSLTVRGTERPYASEYAKMLQSIHETSAGMTSAESLIQSATIRLEWKSALEKAHAQESAPERDMTFQLPGKDTKMVIVDESPFYQSNLKTTIPPGISATLTNKECKDVCALQDFKVGENVVLGYERGLLRNNVYVVIKA